MGAPHRTVALDKGGDLWTYDYCPSGQYLGSPQCEQLNLIFDKSGMLVHLDLVTNTTADDLVEGLTAVFCEKGARLCRTTPFLTTAKRCGVFSNPASTFWRLLRPPIIFRCQKKNGI